MCVCVCASVGFLVLGGGRGSMCVYFSNVVCVCVYFRVCVHVCVCCMHAHVHVYSVNTG